MPVRYYLPSSMNSGHQQMYVPQYYQPQVAAAYPVRQTPAYQVKPVMVVPFDSRSGSVSSTDSCKADKLKTEAAMKANLKTLENINNANLTSTEIEKIFGQEFQSRSGSSCSVWKGLGCVTNIGFAVPGCLTSLTNPVSLAACVGGVVGAGNECLPCVCFIAEKITDIPGC